jgi:dihydroorotase
VTAEVTPHHLTLTDERRSAAAPNTKMAPPLRSAADVAACRAGLADGTLDAIATDHAPHAVHEKDVEFTAAPPGVIGLETAVPVTLALVREHDLAPLEWVRRLATNPARIIQRAGGSLEVGAPAVVVVVDPERRWTYDPAKGFSKSRNSPWAGREMIGRIVVTLVGRAGLRRRTRSAQP